MKFLLSLSFVSLALTQFALTACNGTSSRTETRATAATSATSGLEEVTILARGME